MENFKKLIFLLTPSEQRRAGLLLIMILVMALIDTIGVASILPFMAVLTNPDIIETNLILKKMYQTSNIFELKAANNLFLPLAYLYL